MARVNKIGFDVFSDDGTGVDRRFKKFIILGSGKTAPLIKDFDTTGYTVLAINNAWRLNKFDWLIYPSDFVNLPSEEDVKDKKVITFNEYSQVAYRFGGQAKRGNTMMFNAAYYALSYMPSEILFLGCDMDYPTDGSNTHFYGTGTPDPLRLGVTELEQLMQRLKDVATQYKCKLYNLSPSSCNGIMKYQRAGLINPKKALFTAFNEKFIPYATVLIKSFFEHHKRSEWDVHCYCVNVSNDSLNDAVFKMDNVFIHNEDLSFISDEHERCYMNSCRFVLYSQHLAQYDFVYMSDADAVFLKSIDSLNRDMFGNDVAICKRAVNDKKRIVSACSIAYKNTQHSRWCFTQYEMLLNKFRCKNMTEWFNDQLVWLELLNDTTFSFYFLKPEEYVSYQDTLQAKVLVTSTENKFGNKVYKKYYDSLINS
jgi:hypothetical protein